jgi:hypothetical protein
VAGGTADPFGAGKAGIEEQHFPKLYACRRHAVVGRRWDFFRKLEFAAITLRLGYHTENQRDGYQPQSRTLNGSDRISKIGSCHNHKVLLTSCFGFSGSRRKRSTTRFNLVAAFFSSPESPCREPVWSMLFWLSCPAGWTPS